MRALIACSVVGLLSVSACQLFANNEDPPVVCPQYGDSATGAIAVPSTRNPYSGQCEDGGWRPPPGCGNDWGAAEANPVNPVNSEWPVCYSGTCEALDEATCVQADGCRAIYDQPEVAAATSPRSFVGCWPTAQNGPVRGGDCTTITDAFICSQHDDCATIYWADQYGSFDGFALCVAEPGVDPGPGCYSDTDCQDDQRCNATEVCLPPPGCDSANGMACPPVCYGYCEPKAPPGQCSTSADCDPSASCQNIICLDNCLPQTPGCCTGTCQPNNTETPACATLGEAACIDRTDGCHDWTPPGGCGDVCTPVYEGEGCSCNANSCSCESWSYQTCQ